MGLDINDRGEIVGFYQEAAYFGGTYTTAGLGTLGGSGRYSWSVFRQINNSQFIVGQSTTGVVNSNTGPLRGTHKHVDPNVLQLQNLGSLAGPEGASNARALNEANVVVGDSKTATSTHAVRFEADGTITDLGTLGGENSSAADINDNGDIVGESQNADGHWRAFFLPAGGSMLDLGTLGGNESRAIRINNRGEIIGNATTAEGEQHAFFYSNGQMHDLGTLGGTNSEAVGLNDFGIVVGSARTSGNALAAFIKYPGQPMVDLASLVELPQDFILTRATAINNGGLIVGHAYNSVMFGFTYLFKPGSLSARIAHGKRQIQVAAPSGTKFRLDRSFSLNDWLPVLTNIIETVSATYTEDLSEPNVFYRVVAGLSP